MSRLVIPLLSLLAASALLGNAPLTIGGIAAGPGAVAAGWLAVPSGHDEGTQLPVTVINGAGEGPVLALLAGVHGYEYAAMIALQRVIERVDPRALNGSVIVVHLANPPAFYGRRIYYGPDDKNLNRVFPGNPKGTITERIADVLTREVIARSTHLIDMHGGDGNESLRPYTYWMRGGDAKVDEASKQLALAYGFDRIVVDDERPESPQKTLYVQNTAVARGIPAITVESGAVGLTTDEYVRPHVDGVLSVMRHLGMLPTAIDHTVEQPLWIESITVLRSTTTGMWQPAVKPDQQVAKGTLVGRIVDPFGNVLEEVRAPFAGQMIYVVTTPPTTKGEPLGAVVSFLPDGAPLPEPPAERK